MRKLIIALAGVALMLGASSIARATLLGDLISFDGVIDTLQDESRGMAVNFDEDNTGTVGFDESTNLTIGDVIFGMVKLNEVDGSDVTAPKRLYAIFALQVTDIDVTTFGATSPILQFGAVATGSENPVDNTTDLDALTRTDFTLESIADALGFDTSVLSDWSNAGFLVIESNSATDPLTADKTVAGDGVSQENLNGYSVITDPSIIGTGAGFSLDIVAGFNDPNDNGDADYYEVHVTNPTVGNLASLRAQGSSGGFGDFQGGVSVLYHIFGASTEFIPIVSEHFDGSADTFHDITVIDGGLNGVRASTAPAPDEEWMYTDNGDFLINAVPEPTTMVVWAGLFGGAAGLGFIRRRRKAKAEQKNAA